MFSTMFPLLHTFAATCKTTFLGLVPWHQYLEVEEDTCRITSFDPTYDPATGQMVQTGVLGAHSPFLLVGLAVLEDLIRVAALIAVGYIIYGGFQYLTSQGAPDSTKKAQQTIINALVGVAIAVVSAAGVSYLGHRLGA